MRLYLENGNIAGLRDVSRWFDENYPADIFQAHPVAVIRDALRELCKKEKN